MEGNTQEYGRPRRPNAETVSYLNGLPIDEKLASEQVRAYVDSFQQTDNTSSEAAEFPALVNATHAALSSVFNEIASLACEEIPAQQIETLVRIACRYSATAKRVVLASLSGYWVFLSTHRFGSHVAQTVLRCAVAECEVNLDEFDDKQDECEGKMVIDDSYGSILQENVSFVPDLLLQAFEELKPFATDLTVHVCGTHVLRTALCILAGVEFVDAFAKPNGNKQDGPTNEWESGVLAATRRGKLKDKKRKKKKRKPGNEDGNSAENRATVMKKMNMIADCQTTDFQNNADVMLKEMVQILSLSDTTNSVQPPGELQQRTCHPSGGPLLVQIVRLLSYRDDSKQENKKQRKDSADRRLGILPNEPKYSSGSDAEAFVHKLLCWDANIPVDGDEAKQPHAGDIIYGLSGEPRGSILLEAIFRSCPDEFHDALCVVGGFYDEATLKEYIYHGVSNFVVQALLNSLRTRNQANKMVKCLCPIIEDGSLLHPKKHRDGPSDDQVVDENSDNKNIQRMGIIWRAVEMCSTSGSSQDQEQLIHALMRGFASISASADGNDAKKDSDGKKKRSKSKGLSAKGCIPLLLGLTPSSDDESYSSNERLTLNAAGARTMYHIFQFTQRLRSDWVNGFLSLYGTNDLARIANDGLGSRCIMDGLLDGPAKEVASKSLYSKMFDRLPFLAAERVGHHVVMKLFRALPYDDKAVMSAELSHSLNRLGSNAMGRSVMASCAVKEYLEGENAWKEALAKQKVNEEWLNEILGEDGGSGDEASGKSRKKRRKE